MTLYQEWYKDHPTNDELCAVLGHNWAVCRDSFKNRCRYGRCITIKEYRAATKLIMQTRQAKHAV